MTSNLKRTCNYNNLNKIREGVIIKKKPAKIIIDNDNNVQIVNNINDIKFEYKKNAKT